MINKKGNILRKVLAKARHPFNEKERFYFYKNPWSLDKASELFRFAETNRIIRDHIGPVGTILEIGSGEGYQSEWLSKLGKVHGIEASRRAMRRAQVRLPQATFELGLLPNIPPRTADLVCGFEVLYYLDKSEIPRAIEILNETAPHRIVSYHNVEKNRAKLGASISSIKGVQFEEIKWENSQEKHQWMVAWW